MKELCFYLAKGRLIPKIVSFIAACAGFFLTLNTLEAAEIRVPSEEPTIQAAINVAVNGDTVLVAPGTYQETINFRGKAITVASTDGPEVTIIDGNRAGPVVTFASGEGRASVLTGFTVQNGNTVFPFAEGGGITIQRSSPTISANMIINNTGCDGLGIGIGFGSPLIQGNVISDNIRSGCTGGTGGGGIAVRGNSTAEIVENIISNNSTGAGGGGISLFASGSTIVQSNVITGNRSEVGGISMLNDVSGVSIVQNLITGNHGFGGGINWSNPPSAVVNNTIADNDGPGIFAGAFFANTRLINNIIVATGNQNAMFCDRSGITTPTNFSFNDVFSPEGIAYGGMCMDQTGQNGNISADPLFVDPLTGDYHLQPGSPAIDAGDNTVADLPATDLDGNPRIVDGTGMGQAIIDMGVYEFFLAVSPRTILFLVSQPGDFIGQGMQFTLTAADGTFSASRTSDNGVQISFFGAPGNFWFLNFAAPMRTDVTPGTYENATRWPFQAPTDPGLSVVGQGRGCNTLTGRFVVDEAVYGPGGEVESFAADLEQHCEGAPPALFGQARFNSTVPLTSSSLVHKTRR